MGCQEPGRSPSSSLPSPQPPSPLSGLSPLAHFAEALPGQFQAAALTLMGTRGPALRRRGSGPRSCQQRARAVEHHGWPRGAAGLSAPRTPHPAPDPPPRVPALRAAPSSLLQPNRPRGTEFRPTSGRARDPPLLGNSGGVSGTTGHPDPGHADPNRSLGGPRPPSPVWHLPVLPTQVPARLAGVRVCVCACSRLGP